MWRPPYTARVRLAAPADRRQLADGLLRRDLNCELLNGRVSVNLVDGVSITV